MESWFSTVKFDLGETFEVSTVRTFIVLVALAACNGGTPASPTTQTGSAQLAHDAGAPAVVTPEARARELASLLAAKDFAHATALFDDEMRVALPPAELATDWGHVLDAHGPFVACDGATTKSVKFFRVVVLTCRFEHGSQGLKVAVDVGGRVSGLFFVAPETPWSPPPYASKAAIEREITVGAAPWQLPGTLTLPSGKGPFPSLVLVHGSGPEDRDETIGPNKPFKDLALGLAADGVATIRYEKRTKVYGKEIAGDRTFTVQQESVDDALAAAALARSIPELDPKRVFVAGHSLGGEIGPRIAQQDKNLAGLILLAGSARPFAEIMREQLVYLAGLHGGLSSQDKAQLAMVDEAITRLHALAGGAKQTPDEVILGIAPGYWLDLDHPLAPELIGKLTLPVLVLQGARDYQVTEVDFAAWRVALKGHPNATFKLYPALNHLFIAGAGKSRPEEYEVAAHVDTEVIHDLAAWIAKH